MAYLLVLGGGIEPPWSCLRRILSPLRLPVPPPERGRNDIGPKNYTEMEGLTQAEEKGTKNLSPSRFLAISCDFFVVSILSQEDSLLGVPSTRA